MKTTRLQNIKRLNDSVDEVISAWLKELKRSGVPKIRRILTQTSPREWEKIYNEIVDKVERKEIKSAEDLEYYLCIKY